MKIPTTNAAVIAALALHTATTNAATTSYCPVSDQICFQWGVPEASASSGSGSVYFQLRASTSYQWVGMGIGKQMNGADMFVMYANGNGNVTLSTRRGRNHIMPEYDSKSGVELLAGSGVSNGQMVANVRCSSCSELKLTSSNGWLSAWKQGSALDSTSPEAQIDYHDGNALFSVDFSKATISSDKNPFVGSDDDGGDSGSGGSGGSGGGSGSGNSPGGGVVVESDPNQTLIYAHGIIMSVVFLLGYPIGAMLMPLLGKWALHAGWQLVTFLAMWAGFGVGYTLARRTDLFFKQCHSQLGVVLVCLVSIQPILGFLHHRHYLKHQQRGIVSHLHVWYGRSLIILGMVNGGLGLQLAGNDHAFVVTYCAVVAVVAAVYIASVLLRVWRTRRAAASGSPRESKAARAVPTNAP